MYLMYVVLAALVIVTRNKLYKSRDRYRGLPERPKYIEQTWPLPAFALSRDEQAW